MPEGCGWGSRADRHRRRASGTFSTMRWFGGVFDVAIAVAVFAEAGGYGSPQAISDGFVAAAGVSALLALLGAIAGLGVG